MGAQIVEIAGQKMAVLPVADYERLLDLVEDKIEMAAAISAERRRENGEEYIPAEIIDRIIAGESALRVWRQYRKMTLKELSAQSGIGLSYISDLERGLKRGSGRQWGCLARALNVSIEDILPEA